MIYLKNADVRWAVVVGSGTDHGEKFFVATRITNFRAPRQVLERQPRLRHFYPRHLSESVLCTALAAIALYVLENRNRSVMCGNSDQASWRATNAFMYMSQDAQTENRKLADGTHDGSLQTIALESVTNTFRIRESRAFQRTKVGPGQ